MGRFGNHGIRRSAQTLEQLNDSGVGCCAPRWMRISQRVTGVANKSAPLGSLDGAASKRLAKFGFLHAREPFESRQKKRIIIAQIRCVGLILV